MRDKTVILLEFILIILNTVLMIINATKGEIAFVFINLIAIIFLLLGIFLKYEYGDK